MGCIRIRDIRERQKPQTIEVRVLRKWTSKGKKEELCYQLVDIYGDGIEATAEVKHTKHFDSLIRVQSCYKLSNYICTGARTYMATVDHATSLVIGQKAVLELLTDVDIPRFYFNFATYDTIKRRIKDSRLLTDYIGRVQKNYIFSTYKGNLRKTKIQDDMGNEVEITLWPEMAHLIGDNVVIGDIVAITSTTVTEHNGRIQLESTHLTTVDVNPDMPQTIEHISRLQNIPTTKTPATNEQRMTVFDLKTNNHKDIQGSRKFACEARITKIQEDRGWYYVLCSKCNGKLYPEQDSDTIIFVCKDDENITPNFRYCINATITDETGSTEAVFFNDSMQEMLNITCEEMVTKHANTANPRFIPQELNCAVGIPAILHLTLKNDGKIVVNNVTKNEATTERQLTNAEMSTFTPLTPIPKASTSKRQLAETQGLEKKFKKS